MPTDLSCIALGENAWGVRSVYYGYWAGGYRADFEDFVRFGDQPCLHLMKSFFT